MTRSLYTALEDLKLEKITIIVPGNIDTLIHDKVRIVALNSHLRIMFLSRKSLLKKHLPEICLI